jgi:hypothetical protein
VGGHGGGGSAEIAGQAAECVSPWSDFAILKAKENLKPKHYTYYTTVPPRTRQHDATPLHPTQRRSS